MTDQRRRACIYCRVSEDREGLEYGVGSQEQDCRELAAHRDYLVAQVFIEKDVSASTLSSKPRPVFDAMLAAVEAGEFDVIIAPTNGRLTRRPLELERLVKLYDRTGVLITTVKSGTDDLSTADGRTVARIKAGVDAAEAERTRERVSRAARLRREGGRIHGGPPVFGYVSMSREDGIGYCQVVDMEAAAAIVRAADVMLAGGTVSDVVRLWADLGLKRPNGKRWTTPDSVQKVLSSPRIAGYTSDNGTAVAEGDWPAIIDRATHEALVEACSPKVRHGKKPRKNLLPGLIFCACGAPMVANVSIAHGVNRYLCRTQRGGCGKVSRSKPWVDNAVHEYVSGRLESEFEPAVEDAGPETAAHLPFSGGYAPAADRMGYDAALETEIAAHEEAIGRLRDSVEAGVFTSDEIAGRVVDLRSKIASGRGEQGKLAKAARRGGHTTTDALRLWEGNDLDSLRERREILTTYVKMIVVKPLPAGPLWGLRVALPRDCIDIIPAGARRPTA